jgi:hypothetical protein
MSRFYFQRTHYILKYEEIQWICQTICEERLLYHFIENKYQVVIVNDNQTNTSNCCIIDLDGRIQYHHAIMYDETRKSIEIESSQYSKFVHTPGIPLKNLCQIDMIRDTIKNELFNIYVGVY